VDLDEFKRCPLAFDDANISARISMFQWSPEDPRNINLTR